MKTIKEEIENSLWESGDNYVLKTNEEIINILTDFGCGETEFHTADINRVIVENERMKSSIEYIDKCFYSDKKTIKDLREAIQRANNIV